MSADVPSLRLVYFDVMAKGMQVTMVAHHSGLSWEGKPEGFAWRDGGDPMKPRAPFGQLPLLFVGGDDTAPVAQTTAIAAVIGKLAGTDGHRDGTKYGLACTATRSLHAYHLCAISTAIVTTHAEILLQAADARAATALRDDDLSGVSE